jgi:hypothetical protein
MTRRDQLSRLADVLIPVGYIAALAGITLWIILCVQDGYARSASTSPPSTGGKAGRYSFDMSGTAGKTAGLLIFGVASAATLVGIILRDRSTPRYKSRRP